MKKQSINVKLEWKDLSLIEKSQNQHVLDKMTGEICSSQFLTIMGPSGAGKSSFLSIITRKLEPFSKSFTLKGKTTINGEVYTEDEFTQICSYVPQEDILLQTLTIQETFDFQAQLKLGDCTLSERQAEVESILKKFNLYDIRNSIIGGVQKKSISGGQKKRVAIGVQLISDPLCLILDQPTSGLDSFNSLKITKILLNLAQEQKKLIIATIHQPSTLMFQNFDQLLILKHGQQIYLNQASKVVDYMETIRVKVDYRMNPCDFFMLELSEYRKQMGHTTTLTSESYSKFRRTFNRQRKEIVVEEKYSAVQWDKNRSVPILHQFKPLLVRNFKNYIRCPSNQAGKLGLLFMYPLLLGILYFDLLDRIPPIEETQKFASFLLQFASFIYLGLFFALGQAVYDTLLVFPTERELVMKEVHSNMYSLNIFYVTKLMIEILGLILPIMVSTTVVYFIVGLENSFYNWFVFEALYCLCGISGYMIGIVAGILCKQQEFATQASPFIVIPISVYGGLVANLNDLPGYSGWLQYLSPLRYGYNALCMNQLDTDTFHNLSHNMEVRNSLGLNGTEGDNIIMLLLLTYGLFVFSFVMLYFRRKIG